LLIALAGLSACATTGSEVQSKLDSISDQCGLPRKSLTWRGQGDLRFKPLQDTKYGVIACVLDKIRAAGIPMKMGLVTGSSVDMPKADNAEKN
jgi:hypothetical protein